eukprot:TRINITY_DN3214_c4_g1_i1.p1 TRINITY_DN3214_c4_g1~~TRINITY_DN3214_c4_g1_i1.p1  ORF type:complete len:867 (-),score=334.75 TRINITY_DN3214_c4_g1_i1:92-2692(-)
MASENAGNLKSNPFLEFEKKKAEEAAQRRKAYEDKYKPDSTETSVSEGASAESSTNTNTTATPSESNTEVKASAETTVNASGGDAENEKKQEVEAAEKKEAESRKQEEAAEKERKEKEEREAAEKRKTEAAEAESKKQAEEAASKSQQDEAAEKEKEDKAAAEKAERRRESEEKSKAALAELARKREELNKIKAKLSSNTQSSPSESSPANTEAAAPAAAASTSTPAAAASTTTPAAASEADQPKEKKKSQVREFMEARAAAGAASSGAAGSTDGAEPKKSKSRSFFVPRSRDKSGSPSSADPSSPGPDSPSSGQGSTRGMMPREAISKIGANDPNIQILDLSKNSIFSMKPVDYCNQIADALAKNTNITEIHLAGCLIPDQGAAKIADVFRNNSTITELDLAQNKIGSEGLVAIANALAENKVIKTLNLLGQNSRFGEASLSSVVRMFDTNTTLTNIIWRLDSKQAWAITKGISRNIEIERRIRDGMSTDDIDPIKRKERGLTDSPGLSTSSPNLSPSVSVERIENKPATPTTPTSVARASSSVPSVSSPLSTPNAPSAPVSNSNKADEADEEPVKKEPIKRTTADESSVKLSSEDPATRASTLRKPAVSAIPGFGSGGSKSTIVRKPMARTNSAKILTGQSLSTPSSPVTGTEPTSPGGTNSSPAAQSKQIMPREVVAKLEAVDPDLKIIDLSKNSIFQMKSNEYITSMMKPLETNPHVTELHLAGCQISDQGAQKIGNMMKLNSTIVELDLAQNKIGSDGLIALAIGLAGNKTCKTLNLLGQNSRFGEASLACVVKMFETNTVLTNIIWRLDSKQAWAITKCISRNKEIERRIRDGMSTDDIDPVKRREKEVGGVGVTGPQDI